MSRLPERDRRAAAAGAAASSWRPSNVTDRDHLHPHLHDRARTWPSPNTCRSPATATSSSATFSNSANIALNSPVRIAGVDVGKVDRDQRDGDNTKVTFTVDGCRPADPRRRLRRDPAADLPRGQLLRRTRPRQPQRAGAGQRRHDPGQPHLDRGPDRRSPHRPAVARPRRPQPPARELWHRPHPQADRRRRPDPAARGERQERRRSPQRRLQVRRRRRPLQRPGHQRLPRHPAEGPLPPGLQRRPRLRRLRQPPARPAGPDRQLRRLHRRPRQPVDQPLDHDPPAGADPPHHPRLAGQPQPHAAAAAHLRDRAPSRRGRAAWPDQRLETVPRPGPPAALGQGGGRRRQAAARIDPSSRRCRPGQQADHAAAAQPAQPLHYQR